MAPLLKSFAKQILKKAPLFGKISGAIYEARGQRPWSFGYSLYKFVFIQGMIGGDLSVFKNASLPPGYGFRLDERVVEYPWFFSRLKDDAKIILDAGSTLNHPEILGAKSLAGRVLQIVTLEPEEYKSNHPGVIYSYQDLRKTFFAADSFDAVVSISTIEHVGMDNAFLYTSGFSGKENASLAYLDAVKEFKRILKRKGSLYLTIPFGRHKNHGWFQVFDDTMIQKLIEVFSPQSVRQTYFRYKNHQWNFASAQDCRDGDYFDIHKEKKYRQDYLAAARCVACLELVK